MLQFSTPVFFPLLIYLDSCVGDFAVSSEIHVPGFVVLSFEILT